MSDLTDTIKETSKIVTEKYKKKIENIYGGMRALPSFLKKEKKVNKKYGETDLLKGKNYYPPKP
jgi:hypothetical protein|tara:strand:+ start:581 stop:772 length:192 start_codon:yes stop_codon:yes gene_type:complete